MPTPPDMLCRCIALGYCRQSPNCCSANGFEGVPLLLRLQHGWQCMSTQCASMNGFSKPIHCAVCLQFNPSVAYVDSSPTNGPLVDAGSTYLKRWGNPQSPLYGDVHYYNYTGNRHSSAEATLLQVTPHLPVVEGHMGLPGLV